MTKEAQSRATNWHEIYDSLQRECPKSSRPCLLGAVNLYHLTSHIDDLYFKLQELEAKLAEIAPD